MSVIIENNFHNTTLFQDIQRVYKWHFSDLFYSWGLSEHNPLYIYYMFSPTIFSQKYGAGIQMWLKFSIILGGSLKHEKTNKEFILT